MQQDYQKKYLNIIRDIVLKHVDKGKHIVFLFGSRATNKFQKNTDVDIGILGPEPIGKIYYKIVNELEDSIVPLKIDVIDFSLVSKKFKKEAIKNIIVWNQPKNLRIN